jgi:hypothetical protein
MTYCAASIVAISLASVSSVASAQNCDAVPAGPARTDCYLGLSQFYRGQSDLAAARARAQSDAAWYRAITGTDPSETQTTSATIKAQTIRARLPPAGIAHVTEDIKDNPDHGRLIEIASLGVPSLVVSYLYTPLGLPAPDYKLTHRKREN